MNPRLRSFLVAPVLQLLALVLLAHAPSLPLAAWPALLAALASQRLARGRRASLLRLTGLLICYALSAGLLGTFASETLRLTLLLVLLLKWAESRSERETGLVTAAALPALGIGALGWSEGMALALLAAGLPLTLLALGVRLRDGLRQLALALPLASVLFLFFPRIPGPLWDIGLSFGLPLTLSIDQTPRGLGVAASLKPGQTQTGADNASATPVLVAEFDNWVPPTSQLYWRGPVFYDFDGEAWRLNSDIATNGRRYMAQGWRSGKSFNQQLERHTQQVRYSIRLTPHQATWLYALDLPASLASESFIGPDWQVLSHTPVEHEMRYAMSSWLEWTAGGTLAPDLRTRALALPDGANPRLRALGHDLRAQGSSEAISRAALSALSSGDYTLKSRFEAPTGRNAFDQFWFERREGNAEFFAGAYVWLMRSAGVPARLVTGYRGGKLMALTNYVVVKRSHAHAWAEIWNDKLGWQRIDPVDVVKPPENAAAQPSAARERSASAAQMARAPQTESASLDKQPPPPEGEFGLAAASPATAKSGENNLLQGITDWLGRWVFKLDAQRQLEMLAGKGGGFAWIWLLLGALSLAAGLFLGMLALTRCRDAQRLPPPLRAWQEACRELARRGLPIRPGECPSRFAARAARERPTWGAFISRLADAFSAWRYGPAPQDKTAAVAEAARQLKNRLLAE